MHIYTLKKECSSFCQSFPFFGVVPAIVDEHGNELEGACEGFLVSERLYNNFLLMSSKLLTELFPIKISKKRNGQFCVNSGNTETGQRNIKFRS